MAADISPDGVYLVTSNGRDLWLWNAASGNGQAKLWDLNAMAAWGAAHPPDQESSEDETDSSNQP